MIDVRKGYLFFIKYVGKGYLSNKVVYKKVRGWTLGWSLSIQDFVEYRPSTSTRLHLDLEVPVCTTNLGFIKFNLSSTTILTNSPRGLNNVPFPMEKWHSC